MGRGFSPWRLPFLESVRGISELSFLGLGASGGRAQEPGLPMRHAADRSIHSGSPATPYGGDTASPPVLYRGGWGSGDLGVCHGELGNGKARIWLGWLIPGLGRLPYLMRASPHWTHSLFPLTELPFPALALSLLRALEGRA